MSERNPKAETKHLRKRGVRTAVATGAAALTALMAPALASAGDVKPVATGQKTEMTAKKGEESLKRTKEALRLQLQSETNTRAKLVNTFTALPKAIEEMEQVGVPHAYTLGEGSGYVGKGVYRVVSVPEGRDTKGNYLWTSLAAVSPSEDSMPTTVLIFTGQEQPPVQGELPSSNNAMAISRQLGSYNTFFFNEVSQGPNISSTHYSSFGPPNILARSPLSTRRAAVADMNRGMARIDRTVGQAVRDLSFK